MLIVISPAKKLDFETQDPIPTFTLPEFLPDSRLLIKALKKLSPQDLSELMGISGKLGKLNADRFKAWKTPFTPENAKSAISSFKGDVYLGLDAESFSKKDIKFAQEHLRILSGLYGVLKPQDLIQPYRLEMGTKFENSRGKNLYEFWDNKITKSLNKTLKTMKSDVLINLASNEYFHSVKPKLLKGRVITPVFKDWKGSKYQVVSFFAKKARGLMSAYIIKNKLIKPEDIKSFDVAGYSFSKKLSSEDEWVFTRKEKGN